MLAAGLTLFAASSATLGQGASKAKPSQTMPLMALLGRFTAPGVPAGSGSRREISRSPPSVGFDPYRPVCLATGWHSIRCFTSGEGYNKIFLVNEGKFIWTYSTGPSLGIPTTCGCSPTATFSLPACNTLPR